MSARAAKNTKGRAVANRSSALSRPASAVRSVDVLAHVVGEPRIFVTALGTIGAGLLAHRGDLTRGGARMLAAHLAASAMRSAVAHRVDGSPPTPAVGGNDGATPTNRASASVGRPAAGNHHLTDMVVGGVVGWVAEALVGAVFDRIEARFASRTTVTSAA